MQRGPLKVSNQLRGILIAAGGATLISFDGLLIRLQHLSSAGVTFWRGAFTCVAFMVVLIAARRPLNRGVVKPESSGTWPVAALAILMVAGTITFVYSLTRTTVADTLVIVASSPIVTAVLGRFLLREELPLRTWLAGLAALAAVAIIFSGGLGTSGLEGDGWAVGNTFVLAFILILLRRYPNLDRVLALAISSFVTALVILPFGVQVPDPQSLLAAAADGLLVVPGGLLLITLAPRYLPAGEVALMLLLETILGPLWVLFALGEALSISVVVSAAIILGAIAVHSILDLRSQRLPDPESLQI